MAGTIQVQTVERKLYEKAIECACGLVVLISGETPNLAARSLEAGGANVVHGDHLRAQAAQLEFQAAVREARVAHDQARAYARAGLREHARVAAVRAKDADERLRADRVRRQKATLQQRRRGL